MANPHPKVHNQIKAKIPNHYYQTTGKLAKLVLDLKLVYGYFPGCAPVGYKNVTNGDRKYVEIDPEKASAIEVAFRLAGDSDLSLRAILKTVTDPGLTSRNGKKLGPSALWSILTNPFYMGIIRYDGRTYQGNHEPLIDEKLFQKTQKNLSERAKTKTR
jgi:hypothetical protein